MLTDSPPRKRNLAGFQESDRRKTLDLPQDGHLLAAAISIDEAMTNGAIGSVRRACAEFLAIASGFYEVPACGIRVLSARPLRVRENWTSELFGDYDLSTKIIRVWMRTAVRKDITSFGTFLSTLCHHLDFQKLGFADSWHTRGFYERAGALYHHRVARRRRSCSGFRCRADAGESTGSGQIGVFELSLARIRRMVRRRGLPKLQLGKIVDVRNPG